MYVPFCILKTSNVSRYLYHAFVGPQYSCNMLLYCCLFFHSAFCLCNSLFGISSDIWSCQVKFVEVMYPVRTWLVTRSLMWIRVCYSVPWADSFPKDVNSGFLLEYCLGFSICLCPHAHSYFKKLLFPQAFISLFTLYCTLVTALVLPKAFTFQCVCHFSKVVLFKWPKFS